VRRRRLNSCVMGATDSAHGNHFTIWSRSLSTHTLVAVINQDLLQFSPNVHIISSAACAPYLLHLSVFYIAFIIPSPEGREGKLQSDRFPSPSNKFNVSHYNHAAYSFIFIHLRNLTHTSVCFCGKLCNERAHLVTTLSDLKLVHVMAAQTHLSDTVLPIKLAEPNINASECHK